MLKHGQFIWYDLMTTDMPAAEKFYRAVVGWEMRDFGGPGAGYTVLSVGKTGIGGIMKLPPEASAAGAGPGWMAYTLVDDVDAFTVRVEKAGGTIHKPPADIPTVGRFSVVADPQGAPFMLFKPGAEMAGSGTPPNSLPPATPGAIGWHELHAVDWEKVFPFYAGLFGWTKRAAVNMGPMGVYQLFSMAGEGGGDAVGGMMSDRKEKPFWLFYFQVDSIKAAMTRVKDNGGQIIHGPMEVPGGAWIVNGLDPQGGMFALVGPQG